MGGIIGKGIADRGWAINWPGAYGVEHAMFYGDLKRNFELNGWNITTNNSFMTYDMGNNVYYNAFSHILGNYNLGQYGYRIPHSYTNISNNALYSGFEYKKYIDTHKNYYCTHIYVKGNQFPYESNSTSNCQITIASPNNLFFKAAVRYSLTSGSINLANFNYISWNRNNTSSYYDRNSFIVTLQGGGGGGGGGIGAWWGNDRGGGGGGAGGFYIVKIARININSAHPFISIGSGGSGSSSGTGSSGGTTSLRILDTDNSYKYIYAYGGKGGNRPSSGSTASGGSRGTCSDTLTNVNYYSSGSYYYTGNGGSTSNTGGSSSISTYFDNFCYDNTFNTLFHKSYSGGTGNDGGGGGASAYYGGGNGGKDGAAGSAGNYGSGGGGGGAAANYDGLGGSGGTGRAEIWF